MKKAGEDDSGPLGYPYYPHHWGGGGVRPLRQSNKASNASMHPRHWAKCKISEESRPQPPTVSGDTRWGAGKRTVASGLGLPVSTFGETHSCVCVCVVEARIRELCVGECVRMPGGGGATLRVRMGCLSHC